MKRTIPRRITLAAMLALVLVATVAFLAWIARTEYRLALTSAEQQNLSAARALAEHAARTFDEAAHLSAELRDQLERQGLERLTSEQINRILRDKFHPLPHLVAASYVDPAGRIIAATVKLPPEGAFVGDREYFTRLQAHNSRDPFISRPLQSRMTGVWVLPVVCRVNRADGSFGGLLMVTLRVDYFQSFYRSLSQQQGQRISLLRTDGWFLAAVPESQHAFATNVADKPLLKQYIRQATSGVFYNPRGGYDSADLMIAYAQLPWVYPAVAVVAVQRAAVLAFWKRRTALAVCGAFVLVGLISILLVANYRRMQRLEDAQQQLRRYQLIVESTDDAVYSKDLDGTIVSWNPGAARLYGYAAQEVLGKNVSLLFDPALDNEQPELIRRIMAGELVSHYETIRVRKNGLRVPVSLTQSGIRDGAGQLLGVAVIARDITERKKTEQEILQARDLAETATRTKSQFLANMSHEIRTPLNAIMGLVHLVGKTDAAPLRQEYLDQIKGSAQTLLTLINDILDLSKVEAGRLELERVPFNLGRVLESLAAMLQLRAPEQEIALSCELAPDIPVWLYGDPLRLEQVLTNLLGNALKFTPPGGSVALRVLLHAVQGNQVVLRFEVQDNGIGIALAQQPILFQPFTQADGSITRRFGGTGLGLTICQELVHLMGGEIFFASQEGQGSIFSFSVPFAVVERGSAPPDAAGGAAQPSLFATDPARLRQALEGLGALLQKHNMGAQRQFAVLEELVGPGLAELEELGAQIQRLEFDNARMQLQRVAQKLGIG